MSKNTYLVLHNIRSAHNVGSAFRTADAVGVSKVFLTGYTPTPIDRFGRPEKEVAKVALGAENSVSWERLANVGVLLVKLKKEGVFIVGVEQMRGAIDYKKIKTRFPCAFVFGNEVKGLSPGVLKRCDVVAEIPMKGRKESLNVSVSIGVALFRILNL